MNKLHQLTVKYTRKTSIQFSEPHEDKFLTDSNKEDVTAALLNPEVLMFVRTEAPKPIEASCCLSETVFSRSINAPPQIKRMSFVSICNFYFPPRGSAFS
jgi:hypothetical protein